MINENIKATGELKIVLRDKDGNIKFEKNEKESPTTNQTAGKNSNKKL
jgi:hypothetical protein